MDVDPIEGRKRGRPPLPDEQKHYIEVRIKLKPVTYALVRAIGERVSLSPGLVARKILEREAIRTAKLLESA